MKLVIASGNPDKTEELRSLLSELDIELIPLSDYPGAPQIVEDGHTFAENAAKKAAGIALFTGLHAVADDSGLCVEVLEGRPGVYSARYAGKNATGKDLCKKLLKEMRFVKNEDRTAYFQCNIAMANPNGAVTLTAKGTCSGNITRRTRGSGGFGYDPVFLFPPAGKTFAQMSAEEKHSHSHRGCAMNNFKKKLEDYL